MGPSDNPPRKHHYIPEFWTKRWVGPDGCAERYTRPIPEKIVSHRKPPSAIGWRESLYILPDFQETTKNFEINFFKIIDQRASDIFDKIDNSNEVKLNKSESVSFSLFILSLLHRSPAAMELLEKSTKSTVESIISDLQTKYDLVRSKNDPETL